MDMEAIGGGGRLGSRRNPVTAWWSGLSCTEGLEDELAGRVRAHQLAGVIRLNGVMTAATLLNTIIVGAVFFADAPLVTGAWLAVSGALLLLQFRRIFLGRNREVRPTASARSIGRAQRNATLLALIWGAVPIMFFAGASADERFLLATVSAGMLCGGALALATIPRAAICFTAVMGFATALTLLMQGVSGTFAGVLLMLAAFLTIVILSVLSFGRQTAQAVVDRDTIARATAERERLEADAREQRLQREHRDTLAKADRAAEARRLHEAAEESKRAALLTIADDFEKIVKSVEDGIARSAAELTASAANLSGIAREVQGQAGEVAETANGARAESASVATANGQIRDSFNFLAADLAGRMKLADEIRADSGAAAAVMDELAETTASMRGIVIAIDEVAEQTNLLSLNATIEAARAGEEGRGFAVVANEIRDLAMRASQSVRSIDGLISSTVDRIERAAAAMQKIEAKSDSVQAMLADLSTAVEEHGESAELVSTHASNVALGADRSVSVAEAMASASTRAVQVADTVAGAIEQLSARAAELGSGTTGLMHRIRA